jgi:predicted double-glycine peptidase
MRHLFLSSLLCVLHLALNTTSSATNLLSPAGNFNVPVISLREAKMNSTLIQQFDFSCGSAALATLLTFQYNTPVTEQIVFEEMFAQGDQQAIRQSGFSLLDMKQFLAAHGFVADGFELPLDKLQESKLPAIVMVSEKGYNHFVVIKGMRNGRILLGDPANGTRAIVRSEFNAIWKNRLLFVIHNKSDLATFNRSEDWKAATVAPVTSTGNTTLRLIEMPNLGPGDF